MSDQIPPQVYYTLGGIFATLAVASLITWGVRRGRPDSNVKEVSQRVRTWWVIVGLFGIALVLGHTASVLFFALVSFLAFKEFLTLIPTRRADHRVLFLAYLSIPFQYYWVYSEFYGMFIVFIPVYLFMLIPTRMVIVGETSGFLRASGTLHWGLMTTVFSVSHAAFLLALVPSEQARVTAAWPDGSEAQLAGPALLLLLVFLTQFNDIAQFCWGKLLGKRKIVPTVSPGKTVAGLIGGVASTVVLAAVIGPYLTILDLPRALIAGLIIGLGGFAGDVSISALKRDLGVKDSGSILPGHGGILDRIDSLTFTAPLFFHYMYYLYA
ncbi:phosphatidate cytidylyltransferase [Stratiformator vulcanicus]|uniref:Phosphatidate cytidylyltransferase n=1 Tax=Stratiformator vulcanicus TaxID=2527980 RepID=A0A517R6N9_9PLAN|nr:phosphatidate cytidylyltransferase [Stratiformator vulcanicus]QDT39503.1 Phosphatidate cytidylyltransferase [Stratiformator vulcanicus]